MAPPPDSGGDTRGLVLVSTTVAQLVVPILVGVWLDGQYGWSPWGLVIGSGIGLIGGAVGLALLYRKSGRTPRDPRNENGTGTGTG